jgi:hypothetical protein
MKEQQGLYIALSAWDVNQFDNLRPDDSKKKLTYINQENCKTIYSRYNLNFRPVYLNLEGMSEIYEFIFEYKYELVQKNINEDFEKFYSKFSK